MNKILIITSVASMVDQFLIPNIRMLQEMDYEVHVACNFEKGSTCSAERITELKQKLNRWNVTYHQVDFNRRVSRFSDNYQAYKQVVRLISDNHYQIIHCHSPIGGLITRIAGRKERRCGTKMFYTAHGFHFYKGAPLLNWLLYYPVEKICAHFTDVLITINREDYVLAKKKMKAKKIAYVPGVGVDTERFCGTSAEVAAKRQELGIPEDAIVMLSVGELNKNKNHETVIQAVAGMNVYYIIAGKGGMQGHLQKIIDRLQLRDRVKLLGFRKDVSELYTAADLFVFSSFREGLPVALMEAMACGKPVCCSRIRGNTDLVDEKGGEMFDPHSVESCARALRTVLAGNLESMGQHNLEVIQEFSLDAVNEKMKQLYTREG